LQLRADNAPLLPKNGISFSGIGFVLPQVQSVGLVVESKAGMIPASTEKEKELLKLKKTHALQQHCEGYIDNEGFQGEMANTELALCQLEVLEVGSVRLDAVIKRGEYIPGITAFWDDATPKEQREMVMLLLELGGLYFDMENKMIAAIKPRPALLPVLQMLNGVVEYKEANVLLQADRWQDWNR
jgi:hypothetical protein